MRDWNGHQHLEALPKCLKEIEQRLGWGDSSGWTSYDFERLSEKIFEQTSVRISPMTLKRVWGKVSYNSQPSTSTLNTLAQFLDFEDWRTYISSPNRNELDQAVDPPKNGQPIVRQIGVIGLMALGLIMVGGLVWLLSTTPSVNVDATKFKLSSKVVAEGLPNSVVFEYDAMASQPEDKIEIQQSWDRQKRQVVSRKDSVHTSIYHTPGFFEAKLLINETVVQQSTVYIPTNGWIGMVERDPTPIYFEKEEILADELVVIDSSLLAQYQLDPRENDFMVKFYWVKVMEDLSFNDIIVSTDFKNDYVGGANVCQKAHIALLFKGKAVTIDLSNKGCVADLRLWIIDHGLNGKTSDLSAFGVDFDDWVNLTFQTSGDQLAIKINGEVVFEETIKDLDRNFSGLKYYFQGRGSIKSLVLGQQAEPQRYTILPAIEGE